jgi:hypothetical protein
VVEWPRPSKCYPLKRGTNVGVTRCEPLRRASQLCTQAHTDFILLGDRGAVYRAALVEWGAVLTEAAYEVWTFTDALGAEAATALTVAGAGAAIRSARSAGAVGIAEEPATALSVVLTPLPGPLTARRVGSSLADAE